MSKRGVKPINFYLLSINWIKATRTDRAASAIALAARGGYERAVPLLLDDVVDEDAGGLDVLGSYAAGGDDLLRLDDDGVGGGGHHGAEVLAGALVDQVALFVGDVGADDGDVGADGLLEEVFLAVDGDFLLAVLNDGAEACLGQHTAEACAGGADLLGEGALGLEGDLQLAGVHLVDGVVVGADVCGDEGLHLVVGVPLLFRSANILLFCKLEKKFVQMPKYEYLCTIKQRNKKHE